MIAIAFILALGAALIAGLLVYWQKIVNWIKKASEKIMYNLYKYTLI